MLHDKNEELLGTIEHLKSQKGVMTTMVRMSRIMKGTSENMQNKFFKEVLILQKKFTDVDGELFEANAA